MCVCICGRVCVCVCVCVHACILYVGGEEGEVDKGSPILSLALHSLSPNKIILANDHQRHTWEV